MARIWNHRYDIEKIIHNSMNIKISHKYHEYDNVTNITINQNNRGYSVDAGLDVRGTVNRCKIYLNLHGEYLDSSCNCIYHSPKKPCAHVGTVLLKLNNLNIESIPFSYHKTDEVDDFNFEEYLAEKKRQKEEIQRKLDEERLERERQEHIQSLNELISKNKNEIIEGIISVVENNEFSLYPEITSQYNGFALGYRIGNETKQYIVKSMGELVEKFESRKVEAYGKNMTIVHDESLLDEFSKQQLHFLQSMSHRYVYDYGVQTYQKLGRFESLQTSRQGFLHEFFNTYQNQEFPTFSITQVKQPLHLKLFEIQDDIILEYIFEEDYRYDHKNMYWFPDERDHYYAFKYMPLDKDGVVVSLLEAFEKTEKNQMLIPKIKWNEFNKYILSRIKDYIYLEESVDAMQSYVDCEQINVYGDINDEGEITVKIHYIDSEGDVTIGFNDDIDLNLNQEIVETVLKKYAQRIENNTAYFDDGNDKTIEFFATGIEKISPYCELYVSDALKRLNRKAKHTITVGVRLTNDLLMLDIESIEIPKNEIGQVLRAYRRKKKYYRLKNGDIIKLNSEALEELDQMVDELHLNTKDLDDGHVEMNKYRAFDIESLENTDAITINKEDTYKNVIENIKTIHKEDITIPEAYDAILRDYQKDGYRWLYTLKEYNFNGILADDMGLGKTLQVIALLDGLENKQCSLVVCPASLIYNWEDEVHKFSKTLKAKCVIGNKEQRKVIINSYQEYDLLITSYDYMRRDYELYENKQFEYVILDEAQNIKNQKTKNAIAVKSLQSNHRLALTGTPIENTLAELWSIFDFLMPDYLYNYHFFKKSYESPIVRNNDEKVSHHLKKLVQPFILRRNKKEVLAELPDKVERSQIIPFNERENELYLASLVQANQQLQELLHYEQASNDFAILALLTKLRQICIEPRMLYENIDEPSSKIIALLDLLTQVKENDEKALVFSSFPSVFDLFEDELIKKKISYQILTGQTSKEDRKMMVEKFQNNQVDVFLISLKAGGTGLNLTAASTVIHIDPWWNISAQNQATDRAYRFGQNKNVQVIKLVMKNSIEEKIVKLQEIKKTLSDVFVENNQGTISNMSKDEIINLFKM